MEQCLRHVLDTGATAEVTVQSFALRKGAGPFVITVEPIASADGVTALGVRAKDGSSTKRRT
ncbi:MAG: hypothetical protein LAP38_25820, partial [Acidobacteriia bacterium]|nr:hypothetical protein [Terriglobia bacterium]